MGQLHERIIPLPKTLDEVLLELNDGLVNLARDLLQTLALLIHLLELQCDFHQARNLERSQLSNDCKRFSEDGIFNNLISEHVAEYEQQRHDVLLGRLA